jgi:hypothetical protein
MITMFRFIPSLAFVALLILACSAKAADLLDAPVSFSATRTVTVNGKVYIGPMFHVPGHERHEQSLLGMQEVFILDDQQSAGVLVMPALKTMVEFPFPPLLTSLLDSSLAKSALGEEKVDDILATKYRVEETTPDGTRGEGFLWISRRGVLLKMEGTVTAPGGHRTAIQMALSNVREAPQAPALFTPPSGLNKLPAEALAPLLGFRLQ